MWVSWRPPDKSRVKATGEQPSNLRYVGNRTSINKWKPCFTCKPFWSIGIRQCWISSMKLLGLDRSIAQNAWTMPQKLGQSTQFFPFNNYKDFPVARCCQHNTKKRLPIRHPLAATHSPPGAADPRGRRPHRRGGPHRRWHGRAGHGAAAAGGWAAAMAKNMGKAMGKRWLNHGKSMEKPWKTGM